MSSHPVGMSAISRGLSEAIPPERDRAIFPDPVGVVAAMFCMKRSRSELAVTPMGSRKFRSHSGGIAALDPRLMAGIPPGSGKRWHLIGKRQTNRFDLR